MKRLALLVMPLLIAASPSHPPRPIAAAEQAAIKNAADDLLFDGPSARWKWPPKRSAFVYCGEVNAKNRMGAYIGWHPFYFVIDEDKLRILHDGDDRIVYEALCASAGYIPKPAWLEGSSAPSVPASPAP